MATARSIAHGAALRFAGDLELLADGRSVPNRRVRFGARKWRLGGVIRGEFADSQHTQYYVSPARCGGGKGKEKEAMKDNKKKLKLLKRLSDDLQMFASGKGDGGMIILEAQKVLLAELEMKRKKNEEKERERALMALRDCCESESSASSSSESSDSDREEKVRMMRAQQRAKSDDSDIMQDDSMLIETIPPIGVIQEEQGNGGIFVAGASSTGTIRKIEVCMGGKCKKQGAVALMDDFQRKVGGEAMVTTCKCMGKCKEAPNVRVLSSCANGFQELDGLVEKLLCVGVGLEDVDAIVANLLGEASGSRHPPAMAGAAY